MKTHSYSHRISNRYLTKVSFWRGKPAPAAYFMLAVTYMQFKESWGESVACSMGKGEGTSRNRTAFPARPLTATCQETRRLFEVSRTLLLSYHLLCYGARLRNSWILEISPVRVQPTQECPSSVSTGNCFDYFSGSISFFTDFLSELLLIARSIYCVLNFVLSYASPFFFVFCC